MSENGKVDFLEERKSCLPWCRYILGDQLNLLNMLLMQTGKYQDSEK